MDIFLAGTPVTLTVPLIDRYGNAIAVDSINYRVIDQTGTEVVSITALTAFVAYSPDATVSVPAVINNVMAIPSPITANQIDEFTSREIRTIELFLNIGGNTAILSKSYALEPEDSLIVGINSFQLFSNAELHSLDIPGLVSWSTATDNQKIAAMVDARAHICQLNFWLLNSNLNWGQDNMNYIPDGAYQSPYISNGTQLFMFNGNLSLLTPTQFIALPVRFRMALCKAQVAEADSIMSGSDTVVSRRIDGMILDTIGESKQMYRSVKPLDLPVSKRALRYLSEFVTFSKRIGRG